MSEVVRQHSTADRSAHVRLKPADLVRLPSGGALAAADMDLDRELIAAGQEYAALEDEYGVVCRVMGPLAPGSEFDALNARLDAISDRQDEILDMMLDATPRTPAGLRAMALAAACKAADSSTADKPVNYEERLSFTVLLHILGRA